jgi:hypothetical protein
MNRPALAESNDVADPRCDAPADEVSARHPAAMPPQSPVRPFLVGTLVGGLAGAALGTLLSPHTRGFFVGLYHLLNRRISSSERDQLRFELLLQ